MAIELVSCPACGRKNASDRTTCLSCGNPLANPAQPILHRWPFQRVVVAVAALLLAVALLYRLMASPPGRDRNVKTETAGLKEQSQTPVESRGKGTVTDLPTAGPPVVANMATPSYPVDAGDVGARSIGATAASSKPAACDFVINPKTGHITTARRLPAHSGYVPVKLKPGNVSGSYVDPVTGNDVLVGLPPAPDPFAAMVRAAQVALCDQHDRGEISTAELDARLNEVAARAREAKQNYAGELQRLAAERQKLALEQQRHALEIERQRQALEMQRRALEAQQRTAQQALELQRQKVYLDALRDQQALELQQQALRAQQLAAQQARENIIMQEVLRGIFGRTRQSANCRVVRSGNGYQVDCY